VWVSENGSFVTKQPELSVVIPLTDARGDAVEHLRTWTHGQTLDRDRYQVVIASDAEEPEVDREVAELLEPHDAIEMASDAGLLQLYNTAAGLADSQWLLFTENHCEAEPETLARAVEGIQAALGLEAASLEHGHLTPAVVGELGARWFDDVYEEWFEPGTWRRLNLAGFVIRRDTFHTAGGLDARYGVFAAPLLAARLDERGAQVGHLPQARILHVHVDDIDEHHGYSADYAEGESEARTSLPPTFAERYFGHQHLLWNRAGLRRPIARRTVSVLARELARASLLRREEVSWLLGELWSRLPPAFGGVRPQLSVTHLAFRWSEFAAGLPWLSLRRRYRRYLRAQERVVRLTQLRWIAAHPGSDRTLAEGSHVTAQVGEGVIVGVHGLERFDDRPFRWSEPVLTIRLGSVTRGTRLRIDTGGLRGSPRACVIAAYLDGTRLPQTDVSEERSELVVSLPDRVAGDLTLLCRPLDGSADDRPLGLPLFSIVLRAASSNDPQTALPEPAPVI
jgi:hypothetical protein